MAIGDPQDPIALQLKCRVACAVTFECRASVMERIAVELHHEPPVGPSHIHLVARNLGVDERRRQSNLSTQPKKLSLEPRSRAGQWPVALRKQSTEGLVAAPPRTPLEQTQDGGEIEEVPAVGVLERPLEPAPRNYLGEIEERSSDACDRNPVDGRAILTVKSPHLMQGYAGLATAASPDRCDVDS